MRNKMALLLPLLTLLQIGFSTQARAEACCFMALDGEVQESRRVCRATLEQARDASRFGMTANDLQARCRQINRTGFGRFCTVECFELQ